MIDTPVAKGGLLTTCFHPADCYSWTFPQSALLKVPLGCFNAWYTKMASSSRQFCQRIFRGGLPMGHQSIRVMCRAKINRKRVISWFVGFPTVRHKIRLSSLVNVSWIPWNLISFPNNTLSNNLPKQSVCSFHGVTPLKGVDEKSASETPHLELSSMANRQWKLSSPRGQQKPIAQNSLCPYELVGWILCGSM